MSRSHAMTKAATPTAGANPGKPTTPGKRTLTQNMQGPPVEHLAMLALETTALSIVRLQKVDGLDALMVAPVVMTNLATARAHLDDCEFGTVDDLEKRYLILEGFAQREYQRIAFKPRQVKDAKGKQTGVADVDNPPLCESPPEDAPPGACWLSPESRLKQAQAAAWRLMTRDSNFVLALEAEKIERRFQNESHWGLFAEILFGVLSSTIIGAIAGVYARWLKTTLKADAENMILMGRGALTQPPSVLSQVVTRVPEEHVKGTAVNMSKGLRTALKNRAHHTPSDNPVKYRYLSILQLEIQKEGQTLRESLQSMLTDDELVVLTEALDIRNHSVEIYRAQISALMERFDEHKLATIGEATFIPSRHGPGRASSGRLDVVRFVCNGKEQHAEIQQSEYSEDRLRPKGKRKTTLRNARFIRWIDDDFVAIAVAIHKERVGDVLTVDVSDGRSEFVPVIMWSAQVRQQEKRP